MRYAVIALCLLVVAGCQTPNEQIIEAANRSYVIGFGDGMDAINHMMTGDSVYADSLIAMGLRIELAVKKGEPIDTGFMFIP